MNFGLIYGRKADGLRVYAKDSYGVDMSEDESKAFRAAFFREYEGIPEWHHQAWREAEDPSVTEVRTRIGRRRYLPDNRLAALRSLVNTPVQGGCAEVQKLAMLDIDKQLIDKAILVNCVHDELIVECAESDAAYVRDEVSRIMQQRFADVFKGTHVNVEATSLQMGGERCEETRDAGAGGLSESAKYASVAIPNEQ